MILGIVLVIVAGYLAAEHPSAFANAAIPFMLLGLMLSFITEQDNISRAGRYIREVVEADRPDNPGWEHWLESKQPLRVVDHCFVIGFSTLFLVFYAISASLSLRQFDRLGKELLVWSAGVAYALGLALVGYVLCRPWQASTAPDAESIE